MVVQSCCCYYYYYILKNQGKVLLIWPMPVIPASMGSGYLCALESSVCIFASCHIRFAWFWFFVFFKPVQMTSRQPLFQDTAARSLYVIAVLIAEVWVCLVSAGLWPQAVPQADAATGGHGAGGGGSTGRGGGREYSRTRKCWWNRSCSQWVSASFTVKPKWGFWDFYSVATYTLQLNLIVSSPIILFYKHTV